MRTSTTPSSTGKQGRATGAHGAAALAIVTFLIVVGLLGYRATTKLNVPGAPDEIRWVMNDFRDAIYCPVVTFLAGRNPYAPKELLETCAAGNTFPLYAPHTLIVHLPFGVMPLVPAEVLYFFVTVALTVVVATLALSACGLPATTAGVLAFGAALLASRPGHWNLLLGQYAATLTVGCYLALHHATRRQELAALGVALSALKPTFGVPLALLMLCRGQWRPVVTGGTAAALVSAVAVGWIANGAGGIAPLLAVLPANHAAFEADPNVHPLASPYRVDAVAFIARLMDAAPGALLSLVIAAVILGTAALAVRRLNVAAGAEGERLSNSIICLAILSCAYHQSYDSLLLALPLVAATSGALAPAGRRSRVAGWMFGALLLVPMANYLASGTALDALRPSRDLRLVIGGLNSAALLAAFAVAVVAAFRWHPTTVRVSDAPSARAAVAGVSLRTQERRAL